MFEVGALAVKPTKAALDATGGARELYFDAAPHLSCSLEPGNHLKASPNQQERVRFH